MNTNEELIIVNDKLEIYENLIPFQTMLVTKDQYEKLKKMLVKYAPSNKKVKKC